MFYCKNGPTHKHETVRESKICYGLIARPYSPPPSAPIIERPTTAQLDYVERLGGSRPTAELMSKAGCSKYIDSLLAAKPATPTGKATKLSDDPRLELIKSLFDRIPDGYFCVTPDDSTTTMTFLRISTPPLNSRTSKYPGARKIQTQHGPDLDVAAALWPSGKWSIYKSSIIEPLLLLVADYQSAALRYAREIGKCCRCNSPLTDERSRHYGIGPICDGVWPWIISMVDELNDGKTFDQLLATGRL